MNCEEKKVSENIFKQKKLVFEPFEMSRVMQPINISKLGSQANFFSYLNLRKKATHTGKVFSHTQKGKIKWTEYY